MTLRARLALSLVIIAAVLVVPLFVARGAMNSLDRDVRGLRDGEFQASILLGRLRDALAELRAGEVALGIAPSDTTYNAVTKALAEARSLSDSLLLFEVDTAAQRIRVALQQAGPGIDREWELLRANEALRADTVSQEVVLLAFRDADRALLPVEQALRRRTRERVAQAADALQEAERITLASLAIALLLATVIALWLTRSISRPVHELERGMRAVAEGDLDYELQFDVNRKDEFGELAGSFQEMTRQLKELDKLKAEFVSIASHELKTPINVIQGYLSLMQEGVYGPLTEKQLPVTKTIAAQAKTLGRLAGQLLDVSRFEAGGGRIEPRPVKLLAMLDELERTFHVLAVQREVNFRVTRCEGLPEEVTWDAERINEVTGNLLSNAFKFTPAGGTLELIAGPHEKGVCIEVRDTGAGIAPDQLKHVFEKFYQADNQKSASAKGTGLGLAIAKEIVEAHQGKITVMSAVGKGTTFTLILPKAVVNRRRTGSFRIVGPPAPQEGR